MTYRYKKCWWWLVINSMISVHLLIFLHISYPQASQCQSEQRKSLNYPSSRSPLIPSYTCFFLLWESQISHTHFQKCIFMTLTPRDIWYPKSNFTGLLAICLRIHRTRSVPEKTRQNGIRTCAESSGDVTQLVCTRCLYVLTQSLVKKGWIIISYSPSVGSLQIWQQSQ